MKKEFNLSEKKRELFLKLCNRETDVAWIIQVIEEEIEKQDKEFIKLLKIELKKKQPKLFKIWIDMVIDKLAGYSLIKDNQENV